MLRAESWSAPGQDIAEPSKMGQGGSSDGPPEKFEKGGSNDVSAGPMDKRSCTDIICLIIFICSWGVYLAVTMAGVQDGNPSKLYRPRDYKGQFCGIAENWNGGLNLENQEKLTYMMNVSESVDRIAKQFLCSSVGEQALRTIWSNNNANQTAALNRYMCACCKIPCKTCLGSLDIADIKNVNAISTQVGGRMGELTNSQSGDIFSPSGANAGSFGDIWAQANRFFVPVCSTSCAATAVDNNRTYTYRPFPDDPMSEAWRALEQKTNVQQIKKAITQDFVFKALPASVCPYESQYCVPFPGVEFKELTGGYCMFKLSADAVSKVGDVAGAAFEGLGAEKITSAMTTELGSWTGDFVDTIDAFVIVSVCAFAIGLIFLVLLRFFVGCVVWASIFLVFALFMIGGGVSYVRSFQCRGVGFFESGQQTATSIAVAGQNEFNNQVGGKSSSNEGLTGRGADYRGVQVRTRSGTLCQAWNVDTPHVSSHKNASYPTSDLQKNYCRNPGGEAASIWCYTTKSEKRWELCNPIGVINSECFQGYEVEDSNMRKALEIIAYILFVIAALWVVAICFMCRRILLAIAVNKVAAVFVMNTPSILLVPMIQTAVGAIWCLAWASSAAFLLSQVPDTHVPSTFYETYATAYGTDDVAGKCTGPFVNGEVYKYAGNLLSASDPCSGKFGDTTGITPRCWGCFPPRYIIDWRFAISFFCFLWNNAFLIASGQLIVAVACGVWFFTPREEKGKKPAVRTGLRYCFRYHCGSVAMGSFLVALVQFIRYALMYFEKQATAAKNKLMACVLRIVQCLLWCLEKCIKFINRNAYIQIALTGKNFCAAAKAGLTLFARNFVRFAWIVALGGAVNFIGLAFIVVSTAVVGYFILKAMHPEVTPVLPMIVYIAVAYLVGKLYMNVFHLAVGTVLHGFLCTEEMGGDGGWVPSQLRGMISDMENKPMTGKGEK